MEERLMSKHRHCQRSLRSKGAGAPPSYDGRAACRCCVVREVQARRVSLAQQQKHIFHAHVHWRLLHRRHAVGPRVAGTSSPACPLADFGNEGTEPSTVGRLAIWEVAEV